MLLFFLSGVLFFFLNTYFHGLYLKKVTGDSVYMFRVNKQPNSKEKLPRKYFDSIFVDEHPDENSESRKIRVVTNIFATLAIAWLILIVLFAIGQKFMPQNVFE